MLLSNFIYLAPLMKIYSKGWYFKSKSCICKYANKHKLTPNCVFMQQNWIKRYFRFDIFITFFIWYNSEFNTWNSPKSALQCRVRRKMSSGWVKKLHTTNLFFTFNFHHKETEFCLPTLYFTILVHWNTDFQKQMIA